MPAFDALVVGAGPVGCACALELGARGVRTLLVEPALAVSAAGTRAPLVNLRSAEHLRRWGISERAREVSTLPPECEPPPGEGHGFCFATTLTGYELFVVPFYVPSGGPEGDLASEEAIWLQQFQTIRLLEERAAAYPSVTVRRGWRFTSLEQDDDGVDVEIEAVDGGEREVVRASFVLGADGGRGDVRRQIGSSYGGTPNLGRWLDVFFRAPTLFENLSVPPAAAYMLLNPSASGVMRPIDRERWDIQLVMVPDDRELSAEELDDRVRAAIGRDDIPFEVTHTVPIGLHDLIASTWRDRRVFLLGDAAHLIVHFGGHNFNVGLGDAVDLSWKVAAVIQGWGGPGLLESYELERRPIAERVRNEAVANMASQISAMEEVAGDGVPQGGTPDEVADRKRIAEHLRSHAQGTYKAHGIVLDQRYERSPIVMYDGTVVPAWDAHELSATVAPGHRAPHVPEGSGTSLHDAFGPNFTLLRLAEAEADGSSIMEAAKHREVPLHVLDRGGARYREAYGARLTLIRPDGQIAWRGDDEPADGLGIIDVVRGAEPPPPGSAPRGVPESSTA